MVLGQLDIYLYMQTNEDRSFLYTIHINSKCFIYLNVRAKTIKLSEEVTGAKCDSALSNAFLESTKQRYRNWTS